MYNYRKSEQLFCKKGMLNMTVKEELKELILSLNAEELEKALTIFQDHFSKKREESPLHSPKVHQLNQSKLA